MKNNNYYINKLTTCYGANTYSQNYLMDRFSSKLSNVPNSQTLIKTAFFIYDHSKIKQRHFEFSLEDINKRKDWYLLINESVRSIGYRVLTELFSEALKPIDCDAFITVSSSHAGFPGLSRHLQERVGFSKSTLCYDLTGAGCVGATNGIYMAHLLLESGRYNRVCLLCADLLGTQTQSREYLEPPTMSQIVANCLVSDGAIALILSRDNDDKTICSYKECKLITQLWPNSLELNMFSVTKDNQPYVSVGKDIQTRLLGELEEVLPKEIISQPVYLHPGGIALMNLIKDRYPQLLGSAELSIRDLTISGNLGASSVMFVLARAIKEGTFTGSPFHLISFGPGKVTAILSILN